LHESGLTTRFPQDAMRLLNAIIENQPSVLTNLRQCLDEIAKAESTLSKDPSYQRLTGYARQRGM
jgi:hypothetical protein